MKKLYTRYEEEREKVAEDEMCSRLEKELETNAIANLNKCNSIGLNSARKVKNHFFDTHIPFDKTALLVEAIKLFNALSPEEKKRKKKEIQAIHSTFSHHLIFTGNFLD